MCEADNFYGMDLTTISIKATEPIGFVELTCIETLDGRLRYDIVLHRDEQNSGNARSLTFEEAHEYLDMLFSPVCYNDLRDEAFEVLKRVTFACSKSQEVSA